MTDRSKSRNILHAFVIYNMDENIDVSVLYERYKLH